MDGRGKRITLIALPRRIVSLTPSNTEILFDLGLKGRIVADTSACDYPADARALPHIGDYRISVEKVLAQRPDLVVAHTSMNHQAIDQLERLRVPVFAVDPANLQQTYDAIQGIGRITGTELRAHRIVAAMRARVDGVRRKVGGVRPHPRVLVVIQVDPLMVACGSNFVDELISLAGGDNVARDAGPGFKLYSPERVVVQRPDAIFAGRSEIPLLRSKPGWAALPAVRNNALYVTPETMERPCPRIVDALEAVARDLHPRAFTRK